MSAPTSHISPAALVESPAVRVSVAAPTARFSLRACGDLTPMNEALGLTLPDRVGQRAVDHDREVICLGPDEWMLHTSEADAERLVAALGALYEDHPHSLVDVSGREVSFEIEGPRAEDLLTLGMARDPQSIAVGEGRRTCFDGRTVILWRDRETRFRLDVWCSFAPYVSQLLETGCRELAAEAV